MERGAGFLSAAMPSLGAGTVALDPWPEAASSPDALGLVRLDRERFVGHVLDTASRQRASREAALVRALAEGGPPEQPIEAGA